MQNGQVHSICRGLQKVVSQSQYKLRRLSVVGVVAMPLRAPSAHMDMYVYVYIMYMCILCICVCYVCVYSMYVCMLYVHVHIFVVYVCICICICYVYSVYIHVSIHLYIYIHIYCVYRCIHADVCILYSDAQGWGSPVVVGGASRFHVAACSLPPRRHVDRACFSFCVHLQPPNYSIVE